MGSAASSTVTKGGKHRITMSTTIGFGSFSTVKRAVYIPSKAELAVKVISIKACTSRSGGLNVIDGELRTLKAVGSHPFLCNLHFAYHDNSNCYMVMDLLEGGDLRHHINHSLKFTEKGIAFIAACISSALNHIHSHGIIHRDVKPENIVFDCHGYPRLIDFGIAHNSATCGGSMVCTQSSGTFCYLAPEVLTPTKQHSIESDFWSLGVVLYELMFLRRPFSKHCPRTAVHFVSKSYQSHWESSNFSSPPVSFRTVFTETVVGSQPPTPKSSTESSLFFDEAVPENPIPSRLLVELPPLTACGSKVSSDFTTLVQGLLDPRVPQRLGAGVNFTSLRSHPFFNVLDVSWDELLEKKYPAPFDICIEKVNSEIQDRFALHPPCRSPHKTNANIVVTKEQLKAVLDEYTYTAPQYLSIRPTSFVLSRSKICQ